MKLNIEVDCTAEEAREFLGFPDLRPMQNAVLGRVESQLMDATKAISPEGILKMWLSIVPASSEQYLKTISSLFRMPGDKSEKS
jgi:hypothetical protein